VRLERSRFPGRHRLRDVCGPRSGSAADLVWGPAAIYPAITGKVGWGIGLALRASVVVGLIDKVLRPVIGGRQTELPDPVVLVFILGGIGAVGILPGPIVAATFDTALGIYRRAFAQWLPR
jgi:predicted PurR-regulated permease PerM